MPTITTKELTTLTIATRSHHTIKSRLAVVNFATEHGLKRDLGTRLLRHGARRQFGAALP
ncbi:MAG: hypothetical protein CV090_01800 [Nitrospira sp. WS238]|nr:hypothetical protein [Nitrospira sp. WS238]